MRTTMKKSDLYQQLKKIAAITIILCVHGLFCAYGEPIDITKIGLPEGAVARLGIGGIENIAISPNGKQLAVGTQIGVWLYDTQTGDAISFLDAHENSVRSVAFSPDGFTLASGGGLGKDRSIRLWDIRTGEHSMLSSTDYNDVGTLSFSSDGNILVSGHHSGNVILWDVTTDKLKHKLLGNKGQVLQVEFSPDGKTVAIGSLDTTLRLWDVDSGQLKHECLGHTDWVMTVTFSPDSSVIASGGRDGTIRLWDVETGEHKSTFKGLSKLVTTVQFSHDGNFLACGYGYNKNIQLWNVTTENVEQVIHIPDGGVTELLYSPDKKTLIGMHWVGNIHFWDLAIGTIKFSIKNYTRNAYSIAYSTDGKTLASTSGTGITLWDIETRTQKMTLMKEQKGTTSIAALAFSPDNRTIASGDWNGNVSLWDSTIGEYNRTLKGLTDEVRAVAFSSDGKLLASANDHTIRIWDTKTGVQIHTLEEERGGASSVAFSPDNLTLASGGFNGVVRFWDVVTGEQKMMIPDSGNGFSIAYSPDGVLIATTGSPVKLWHAKTGEEILKLDYMSKIMNEQRQLARREIDILQFRVRNIEMMMNRADNVAFSPDRNLLAVSHGDGPINLWDIETQTIIKSFTGHKWTVKSIAFAPDGKTFASGSIDGSILIWEVP